MYSCTYPELFSPIELGGTLFRNRLFASPTGGQPTYYKNRPIPEYIAYYERKATGGAASVCIGDAMPDSEHALANGSHIMLDDPAVIMKKFKKAVTDCESTIAYAEGRYGCNNLL